MKTILDKIVATKQQEVAQSQRDRPLADLRAAAEQSPPPRDFLAAITDGLRGDIRLIAEIKKASPSAGLIVPDFDPVAIAKTYHQHGAAALSVLTDETYFQGKLDFLAQVKRAVSLPILRKDFVIDEYQLYESRAAQADAVLLIVEVLGAEETARLCEVAEGLSMTALIEVHAVDNLLSLLRAMESTKLSRYVIGINNRDLSIQQTNVANTATLAAHLDPGTPFVAESGLATREDVERVAEAGACAILVGESLLRADHIGRKIDELLGR